MSDKMKNTIENSWPDTVRLDMIEKSEWYESPSVYKYGFYDGYQSGKKEALQNSMSIENVQKMTLALANQALTDGYQCSNDYTEADVVSFIEEWRKNNDC